MMDSEDFRRGMEAAMATRDVADQLTTDEIASCGGPDFLDREASDEPAEWHHGWDHVIRCARGEVSEQ
jgi:hypothetical protein